MIPPRLLDGTTYPVMLWNLWRCLASGLTMAEARDRVLTHAGVRAFPKRPANFNCSRCAPPQPPAPTDP